MADHTDHSWPAVLAALMRGEALDTSAAAWAMDEIMAGNATASQLAAFVVLLRAKGETPDELAGLVQGMRDRATPVVVPGRAVDVVGTGGDLAHTVNITTMAALAVAGTGAGSSSTATEAHRRSVVRPMFSKSWESSSTSAPRTSR